MIDYNRYQDASRDCSLPTKLQSRTLNRGDCFSPMPRRKMTAAQMPDMVANRNVETQRIPREQCVCVQTLTSPPLVLDV